MKKVMLFLYAFFVVVVVTDGGRSLNASSSLARNKIPRDIAGQKVQPGATFTVTQLWNLINTRLKKKAAHFLVPGGKNNKVFTDSECNWATGGANIHGSYSAERLGFSADWIQKNGDQQVTLHDDPDLITLLEKEGRIASANQGDKYQKILLYFTLSMNGVSYRLYLNDPYPSKVVNVGKKVINEVKNILNAWEV